jgi:hypothetical protein
MVVVSMGRCTIVIWAAWLAFVYEAAIRVRPAAMSAVEKQQVWKLWSSGKSLRGGGRSGAVSSSCGATYGRPRVATSSERIPTLGICRHPRHGPAVGRSLAPIGVLIAKL